MKATMHGAVIVGGGPIGLACAALLARRRIECCVLDARPLDEARSDARLLALSRGSWEILSPLLGDAALPRAAIGEVRVSSAGEFGATRISAADFGGAELGATVHYGDLLGALAASLTAQGAVEVLRPAAAVELRQRADRVDVLLADGRTLSAEVAIHAEGLAAETPGVPTPIDEDWAILADVRLRPARDDLPAGVAFERFTRDGPIALLPTPRPLPSGNGRAFSLVWCMARGQAQRRAPLGDAALLDELSAALGSGIGRAVAIGPRRALPLSRRQCADVHRHRAVAIGNAAQTLHPVAGQGFNLGLRDCAVLADELGQDADVVAALARYARRRSADRAAIGRLTDNLPGIFASRFAPLALARGLGLAFLDAAPLLRREFAHLLMFGVRL